ncbi:MAG: translation initiation factor IF-2 [Thiothrix sp.]|nr:translation initiation factor IF-2 [Thiothrix sp.]
MSDIEVKELAAMVKAPVDVLLRQLKRAGIDVSRPEDKITDSQKLMLLERMNEGAETVNAGGGKKITLKKREASGALRKSAGVDVRRKKSIAGRRSGADDAPHDPEAERRAEELARKADADRQAREQLIQKAERERRELEALRMRELRRQQEAAGAEPVAEASPDTDSAADAVQAVAVPAAETPVPAVAVAPSGAVGEPAAAEVAAPVQTAAQVSAEETASGKPVQDEPETVAGEVAPAVAREAEATATPVGVVPESEVSDMSGLERRNVVAEAARQEAAAALKRRPSRARPKQTLAPKNTIEQGSSEGDGPEANTDSSDVSVNTRKKNERKKVKTRGRENERQQPTVRRKGGRRDGGAVERQVKHGFEKPTAPVVREIEVPASIVVSDLAQKLAIRATDIIKSMMRMGMMVTINQSIDQETAILVAEELGHKALPMQEMDDAAILASMVNGEAEFDLEVRPPVVTIMGHVDHGKTSLLDYIRETRVASGEAGGITQHIGAYHVDTDHGTVTFLDTPGHAAFTKMRARGAQVTDIVVLIVAADDGVMPQTREAIQHAKAAGVPMVVVINKMDKPEADPERVLSELSQQDVLTEAWGGDIPVVRVSAKTGLGVDALLETLLLVAEVQELRASPDAPAKGNVIEASMERGRGAVATVLIREGTLHKGDILLCGAEYGRVRAMFDESGRPVREAGPSIPVSVLGLSGAPSAGDEALVVADERKAREIAAMRRDRQRDTRLAEQQSAKLDNVFSQMQAGERAQVNLLVKADVQGSVEAIRSELLGLSTDEVEVRILSSGIGGLNEGDIDLAVASGATVVAFNVRADAAARRAAQDNEVEIRYYSVIYDVINDVKDAMSGMLSPETREVFLGLAEVRNVFRASDYGQVAGCLVVEGTVRRGNPIRVLRDNVVIFEGELESLRRHRDDVNEVNMGTECGIAVKNYNDVRIGDQIEVFEQVQVARKI